jgi:serine/threonine protein phosphatase PrpC
VGLLEGASYDTEAVAFGEGDIITLVSDGVSEALDVPSHLLPFAIAEEILRAHSCTPEGVCRHLLEFTRRSRGPRGVEDLTDDRAIVAFAVVAPVSA